MELDLINPELTDAELSQKLNGETARLSWQELESFFARGVVIHVAPELDLVQVAMHFIRDDRAQVELLMDAGTIAKVSDSEAILWTDSNPTFWGVVVAPWVLIQQAA